MRYKDDLRIDKYSLDTEWEKQPMVYMKWAENYAEAVFERDKAKRALELVKAKIDSDIRQNPEKYGFDKKPTEAAIVSEIVQSAEYQDVYDEFIQANKRMNILAGAKEAMSQRKKALESLTDLMIAGYYSQPYVKLEAREKIADEGSMEVRKLLKKNKRIKKEE